MKYATFLSLAIVAAQVAYTSANSVCSSGLYAALAPLDNYPPAVSYCKAQAGKATVTVSATAKKIRRIPRTTSATSSGPTASTASGTTLKTTTTSSSKDAKASSWSSLVAQAKQVVATFCSCAGYPATITVTKTSSKSSSTTPATTPSSTTMPSTTFSSTTSTTSSTITTPTVSTCNRGASSGQVCQATTVLADPSNAYRCSADCDDNNNINQGCTAYSVDAATSTCVLSINCCLAEATPY